MFLEEIKMRRKNLELMLRNVVHKGFQRIENPVPRPELFAESKTLPYQLAATRGDRMHQHGGDAHIIEQICESLRIDAARLIRF